MAMLRLSVSGREKERERKITRQNDDDDIAFSIFFRFSAIHHEKPNHHRRPRRRLHHHCRLCWLSLSMLAGCCRTFFSHLSACLLFAFPYMHYQTHDGQGRVGVRKSDMASMDAVCVCVLENHTNSLRRGRQKRFSLLTAIARARTEMRRCTATYTEITMKTKVKKKHMDSVCMHATDIWKLKGSRQHTSIHNETRDERRETYKRQQQQQEKKK